jgi:hypothetical protein
MRNKHWKLKSSWRWDGERYARNEIEGCQNMDRIEDFPFHHSVEAGAVPQPKREGQGSDATTSLEPGQAAMYV